MMIITDIGETGHPASHVKQPVRRVGSALRREAVMQATAVDPACARAFAPGEAEAFL